MGSINLWFLFEEEKFEELNKIEKNRDGIFTGAFNLFSERRREYLYDTIKENGERGYAVVFCGIELYDALLCFENTIIVLDKSPDNLIGEMIKDDFIENKDDISGNFEILMVR